jgi:hypothetical protein
LQTDGIIRVIPTPANLEDWRGVHFSQTEITDPTLAGDNADPDGDGIGNLLEFLLGTAPRINQPIANRAALPRPSLDRLSDGARLVLDFTLPNSLPSHAIVGIEATDSLGSPTWLPIASVDGSGNWQGTAEVTTGTAGPDRRSVRVRDSKPNTSAARFYRVFGGGR